MIVQKCPSCSWASVPINRPRYDACPFCRGALKRVDQTWDPPLLMAALRYHAKGWPVIPVDRDNKPLIRWKVYQRRRPSEKKIRKWFAKDSRAAGIALVCGQGVYVLDVDPRNGGDRSLEGKSIPDGPHHSTPRGGQHHLFRCDIRLAKRQGILPGVDFQGERSIAILPPTPGYTGLEELSGELPELPQWVIDLVSVAGSHSKPKVPNLDIPLEQQVRFIPEYNRAVIEKAGRKKIDIWVHQVWMELRTLSIQVDKGSGFLDFDRAFDFLIEQGFRGSRDYMGGCDCLALVILQEGMGNHWERTPGGKLSLFSSTKVGWLLEVGGFRTRRWHVLPIPLSQLTDKREKLANFRSVACYDSIDRRNDPKFHPICRKTVQQLSGVSPSTQLADDRVLGLLNGKRRKVGGKAQYRPRAKEETGPPYRQISSKHWSPARLGPQGRLRIIRKALEGRRSDTAYPRYFDDDVHYQKAIDRVPVADDPLVILPQVERRNYFPPVRPTVELWREPVSVCV